MFDYSTSVTQCFTSNQNVMRQKTHQRSVCSRNGFIEYLVSAVKTLGFAAPRPLTLLCRLTADVGANAALCQRAGDTHTHMDVEEPTRPRRQWQTCYLITYSQSETFNINSACGSVITHTHRSLLTFLHPAWAIKHVRMCFLGSSLRYKFCLGYVF